MYYSFPLSLSLPLSPPLSLSLSPSLWYHVIGEANKLKYIIAPAGISSSRGSTLVTRACIKGSTYS